MITQKPQFRVSEDKVETLQQALAFAELSLSKEEVKKIILVQRVLARKGDSMTVRDGKKIASAIDGKKYNWTIGNLPPRV